MKIMPAVAAAALASIISATGVQAQTTMYACYVKNTGTVYRIKTPGTPTKCSTNHTEFSWNVEGQPGPQGPQGPAGPSGFSGITQRGQSATIGVGQPGVWTVWCDPGEIVTGGGFTVFNTPPGIELLGSGPLMSPDGDDTSYGWRVHLINNSAGSVQVTATAICMKLPEQN